MRGSFTVLQTKKKKRTKITLTGSFFPLVCFVVLCHFPFLFIRLPLSSMCHCLGFFPLYSLPASHPHLPSPAHQAAHSPIRMEGKLRRPFFSALLSSPSPRSNPSRRRPIKLDSWVGDSSTFALLAG